MVITTRDPSLPHPDFEPGALTAHTELPGLGRLDALELAGQILKDRGISRPQREKLAELLDFLGCHPLSIQLVVPHLRPKAKKVLDETIAKEPKNPLLWDMAGRFYIATGKPVEAEVAFLKAIDIAPDFSAPYYQLGVIYASQKKFPEAEARLRKVVEKNDKNVGAHALLGLVLNSQGKIDAANKEYRRVLELSPKNISVVIHLGDFYLRWGKKEKVLEAYKKASGIDSKSIPPLAKMAEFFINEKKYDDALKEIEKVAKINPKSDQRIFLKGVISVSAK